MVVVVARRGVDLDAYPDLASLADALPDDVALDGELVVVAPPQDEADPRSLAGLAPFASLQQRLGRKIVSDKTLRELPIAFIAYDLLELEGRDIRGDPHRERRRMLEAMTDALFAEGRRLPLRVSPEVVAKSWEAMDVCASRRVGSAARA